MAIVFGGMSEAALGEAAAVYPVLYGATVGAEAERMAYAMDATVARVRTMALLLGVLRCSTLPKRNGARAS